MYLSYVAVTSPPCMEALNVETSTFKTQIRGGLIIDKMLLMVGSTDYGLHLAAGGIIVT